MSREHFFQAYEGSPPWEVQEPQPAIVRLEEQGKIVGAVLDIGSGTGANAIFLAERGHSVLGIELVPRAVELAKARLAQRGLAVEFRVEDVIRLGDLGRTFDTAIDAGVWHVFSDLDRPRYASHVRRHMKPGGRLFLICFSEQQPGTEGPRRVTQAEIRESFKEGWEVESIEPTVYLTKPEVFGEAKAWLATMRATDVS
jgi:cyclopropane fatty-acyl-phospholipid synthase-like methyltransferase